MKGDSPVWGKTDDRKITNIGERMNERTRSRDLAELTVNCARFISPSLSLSHWEPDLHGSFSVCVIWGGEAAKARGRQAGWKRDDGDLGGLFYGFTTKTRLSTCGPNSSSQTLPSEQSRLNTSAYRPGFPQSSTCVSSVIIHHCIVFIRKEVTGLDWG